MKKLIAMLTVAMMPTMALAVSKPGDADSPADKVVNSAIDAGKIIQCDAPDGSCKGREMNYRVFYAPDKKTAVAWIFGYPSEGTAHLGQYAEFKDEGAWKLVKVFQKPYADAPAPEDKDVQFLSASKVKVTYHFKKDSDANCCATGLGHTVLTLQ